MVSRVAETPAAPVTAATSLWRRVFPISNAPGEIPAMDGLRAIAISLVFFYHVWGTNPRQMHMPVSINSRFLSTLGQMGVLLFFVLSGFLLFVPYARTIINNAPLPSAREFYRRRAWRILPAYWSSVILIAIFVDPTLLQPDHIWHVINHLTFLYTFFPDSLHSVNGVFWSLGIEMQFYLLLPLLAYATRRLGRVLGGTGRALGLIFGCILALSLGWHYYYGNIAVFPDNGTIDYRFFYEQLPSLLVVFAVGMCCAYLYMLSRTQQRDSARRVLIATLAGAVGLAVVIYATGIFGIPTFFDPAGRNGFGYRVGLDWDIIVALGWGAVMLAVLFGYDLIRRVLSLWPLRVLALVSYSFYIWHYILVMRIQPQINSVYTGENLLSILVISGFTVSFVVALVYFHIFERPYLRRKKRSVASPPPELAPTPPLV